MDDPLVCLDPGSQSLVAEAAAAVWGGAQQVDFLTVLR